MLRYVYGLAWEELSKQVSTECIERGLIMSKIFSAYQDLFDKINEDFLK